MHICVHMYAYTHKIYTHAHTLHLAGSARRRRLCLALGSVLLTGEGQKLQHYQALAFFFSLSLFFPSFLSPPLPSASLYKHSAKACLPPSLLLPPAARVESLFSAWINRPRRKLYIFHAQKKSAPPRPVQSSLSPSVCATNAWPASNHRALDCGKYRMAARRERESGNPASLLGLRLSAKRFVRKSVQLNVTCQKKNLLRPSAVVEFGMRTSRHVGTSWAGFACLIGKGER